jgi:hypothetical protein
MRKGLCLICGKAGHFAANCDMKKGERGRSVQDETSEKGRAMQEKPANDPKGKPETEWGPYFPEESLNK